MTIFLEQKELLDILKEKFRLSNDIELKLNIKLGNTGVESIWIEKENRFSVDLLELKQKGNTNGI